MRHFEQLTFLLFLKMADERERLTDECQPIPAGYRWENLASPTMEGADLERHYRETLQVLGTQGGMLGLIFEKAQNRIQDPAKLRRLMLIVELIGQEDWSAMAADVQGDAYEGLLEKNAQDVKGGDVHTLLRLPTGIFYAQGVKANVLFFDRKPGAKEPWTRTVWVYDLRTNKHFTLKTRRMARADLDEFVACYRPCARQTREATWSEQTPDGRWRPYSYDAVIGRDKVSLDLFWLRDESVEDSADLPEPHVLARQIADDLRSALGQMEEILADLEERPERVE